MSLKKKILYPVLGATVGAIIGSIAGSFAFGPLEVAAGIGAFICGVWGGIKSGIIPGGRISGAIFFGIFNGLTYPSDSGLEILIAVIVGTIGGALFFGGPADSFFPHSPRSGVIKGGFLYGVIGYMLGSIPWALLAAAGGQVI